MRKRFKRPRSAGEAASLHSAGSTQVCFWHTPANLFCTLFALDEDLQSACCALARPAYRTPQLDFPTYDVRVSLLCCVLLAAGTGAVLSRSSQPLVGIMMNNRWYAMHFPRLTIPHALSWSPPLPSSWPLPSLSTA